MKIFLLIFLLTFSIKISVAQKQNLKEINPYAFIDKKALQIPDSLTNSTDNISRFIVSNFNSNTEKIRAIFIWVASNIQYDIDNMFAINFYEKTEDKIYSALKSRKGICISYAALFNDICKKTGIKSYIIEGYTKQNGFTDYIPHAWCAAYIDTAWFMFDPTWGSGYVSNQKFIKKINNEYFKALPSSLIKTHMPFDYLWQFLYYPISNQEFYEGKTQENKSKSFFNYKDSIIVNDSLNHLEQEIASSSRIEKNGLKNSMIFDRLQHLKLDIEYARQKERTDLYNSAVYDYNDAIHYFNDFIQYRNKQFMPVKPDNEIQRMLDSPSNKIKLAKNKLDNIKNPDSNTALAISQLNKGIDDLAVHINEQQDWLKQYFSKSKSGRKSMFVKYTWFGIPIK